MCDVRNKCGIKMFNCEKKKVKTVETMSKPMFGCRIKFTLTPLNILDKICCTKNRYSIFKELWKLQKVLCYFWSQRSMRHAHKKTRTYETAFTHLRIEFHLKCIFHSGSMDYSVLFQIRDHFNRIKTVHCNRNDHRML